jgi:hypothetical protein
MREDSALCVYITCYPVQLIEYLGAQEYGSVVNHQLKSQKKNLYVHSRGLIIIMDFGRKNPLLSENPILCQMSYYEL